jgi:isovaleryl-CoA dehydrogenase
MEEFLTDELKEIVKTAKEIINKEVYPKAQITDAKYLWPSTQLKALGKAGLLGLHVPKELGGLEQGLTAVASICEELGKVCPSTAMCFAMHSVGTAVISAKATNYQKENYLKKIAKGNHITTLALSETGTGVHFWLPQTLLKNKGNKFIISGEKDFITNGGYADSYVVSTKSAKPTEKGEFSMVIMDKNLKGMKWIGPWRGFGLHGNSSQNCILNNSLIPKENLLGEEGEEIWYVFEIVAPYFLMGMAGNYLGIAQSSLDITIKHIKSRKHTHTGESLADVQLIQHKIAELWTEVEKTRTLIYTYAKKGDLGDKDALPGILACKSDVGDMATKVVNECMTLSGGMAYRENSKLAQNLRDVRACHVMSPTTDILKTLMGRSLLDLPML